MSRITVLIGVVVISAGMVALALIYPVFWMVFIVPCLFFIPLQLFALSRWRHKEAVFKCTDYGYYLLIGAVVSLGSRYLDQREMITQYEKGAEASRLHGQVYWLDIELPRLRQKLTSAKIAAENLDPDFAAQCLKERASKIMQRLPIDAPPSPLTAYCNGYYFPTLAETVELPTNIADLEQKRETYAQELTALQSNQSNGDLSSAARRPHEQDLMFIWFPMLLLIGVTLKLGKTTCALFPVS